MMLREQEPARASAPFRRTCDAGESVVCFNLAEEAPSGRRALERLGERR